MYRLITIISCLLTFVAIGDAKELYVNGSTGNDSTTYANNDSGNPWATIARAAWGSTDQSNPVSGEAAQAGDTVTVAPGTYSTSGLTSPETGLRYDPVYNPVNSGSSGNLITFKALNPASSNSSNLTILTDTTSGDGQPIIGANNRDYIVWDGFYMDEANLNTMADTGPVTMFGSDYCQIINCHIIGTTVSWSDNHKGIGVQGGSNNATVKNNKIHGFYYGPGATNDNNGCAIQFYNSYDGTVENNELYDCAAGIALKDSLDITGSGTTTIRYNLIYSMGDAGIRLYAWDNNHTTDIYQNVFRDSAAGIRFEGPGISNNPANIDVVNNTFDNHSNGGIWLSGAANYTDNRVYNNIVTNSAYAVYGPEVTTVSSVYYSDGDYLSDYNSYYNNTTFGTFNYGDISVATWQSTYGQEPNNIETTDPSFTNAASDDFTLQAGSPCINAGLDILDLDEDSSTVDAITVGAYITGDEVIGITTGTTSGSTTTSGSITISGSGTGSVTVGTGSGSIGF